MKVNRSSWRPIVSLLLIVAVGGCQYVKAPNALLAVTPPPAVVDQVGVWAFQLWLKKAKVSQNVQDQQLVNGVVTRIVDSAKQTKYARTAEQFKWDVRLVERDQPRAWGFPGGGIIVTTELVRFAKRNPDRVAVAVAHEVVHALARHASERMDAEVKRALVMAATSSQLLKAGLSPEATAGVMVAIGVSWEGARMMPFSRAHESEADHEGMLLMARAGYHPSQAVAFWTEMNTRAIGDRAPEWMSTHPHEETRVRQLQERLPEALELYRPPQRAQR
jgi:predicted Zn-dependent protease